MSDEEKTSRSQGRSTRRTAVERAMRSVLGALSTVPRTFDCCFEDCLAINKAESDAWRIVHPTQLVLADTPYNLFEVPHDKILLQETV